MGVVLRVARHGWLGKGDKILGMKGREELDILNLSFYETCVWVLSNSIAVYWPSKSAICSSIFPLLRLGAGGGAELFILASSTTDVPNASSNTSVWPVF